MIDRISDSRIRQISEMYARAQGKAIIAEFGKSSSSAEDTNERLRKIVNEANIIKSRRRSHKVLRNIVAALLVLTISTGGVLVFSEDARAMVRNWYREIIGDHIVYHFEGEEENCNKETVQMFADYPYYDSLVQLAEKSDIVVYGEVISKNCEERSLLIEDEDEEYSEDQLNDKDIVTLSKVKVIEEFTDSLDHSDISVIQLGGETEQKIALNENATNLVEKRAYVLFLKKSKKWDGTYWLVNETQAAFEVDKDNMTIESDFEGLSFEWLRYYYNDKI